MLVINTTTRGGEMTSGIRSSELGMNEVSFEDFRSLPRTDKETICVYLLRHGESALNVAQQGKQLVQGQSPSVPLTARGVKQANALAQKIFRKMEDQKSILVSSPAKRAVDTAEPLAKLLKQPLVTDAAFLELGSGIWEGIDKKDPTYLDDYNKWQDLSANRKFSACKLSTGESYSEVALRALNGLSEICSKLENNETVFLFSHSLLMQAVILSLMGTELSDEPSSLLPECYIGNGDMIALAIPRNGSVEQGHVHALIRSNLFGERGIIARD
jgi:broad specificity phosphatase PhoE